MQFASDNWGPAHPRIIEAVAAANEGHTPAYGGDPWTERATAAVREVFEAPEAAVFLVATGIAANGLILSTFTQPWDTIFCPQNAHIHEDEANAIEFYTGGAKLLMVGEAAAKFDAGELREAIRTVGVRGYHGLQRGPVSFTSISERGSVYTLEELRAITEVAREFGLKVHIDGARLGNAIAALGCTPAEMTWKAGIDAISLGGTKNGCMAVEAVVFFDPAHGHEFQLRRKRAGQLHSKSRYLGAQIAAYLEDGLWLEMARAANARGDQLRAGLDALGVGYNTRGEANMTFPLMPREMHRRAQEGGAVYHMADNTSLEGPGDEPLMARFACDWSLPEAEVDRFLELIRT